MCRACEWPRLILPVAVRRNRFAAPLCVFSLGISFHSLMTLLILIRWRTAVRILRTTAGLVPLWSEDYEHLIAFHARACFNFADVREILLQFFEDARAEFAVRHFPSSKPDRSFDFVAVL